MAKVIAVDKGGIAQEMGVEVGDELLGFDGMPIVDILDYLYYDAQESFVMNMRAKQGGEVDLEIEKESDEPIGLTLDDSMQLEPMRCRNKCVFCFVDQLPDGMRDTLYVKDDDYRLSFVSGNYVTLTNVSQAELERIVRLRLSPLYISVHVYDPETKVKMISNPRGAKLFDQMRYLADNGIKMHGQIVLCKGLNDGEKLRRTLEELYRLRPQMLSVAVIPVGLTKHRAGLYPLEPIDRDCARATIDLVEAFDRGVGGGFCYCSDEFYLKAARDLPPYERYGDFGQIENGVGLVAEFTHAFDAALAKARKSDKRARVAFVTGQSFRAILCKLTDKLKTKFPNVETRVVDIVNEHFGKSITVAGLITAKDVIAQARDLPPVTVIPSTMLREFTDTFLDGMTVKELEDALNTEIVVSRGGADIVEIVRELK